MSTESQQSQQPVKLTGHNFYEGRYIDFYNCCRPHIGPIIKESCAFDGVNISWKTSN